MQSKSYPACRLESMDLGIIPSWATAGLAREFDIEIIAEDVETEAQLEFLMHAGCSCIQGFYFSRAVPAAQATRLLRQGVVAPAAQHQLAERPTTAKSEGTAA
jgi:predicted signal transduction protein with EAL and GGDEF domain